MSNFTNNQSNASTQVWLVTGASRGLGVSISKAVLAAGHKLVATGRNAAKVADALGGPSDNLLVTQLDVTNEEQAQQVAAQAVERFGRIDVLVNNAGYGMVGAVEETSATEVEAMYRTNVFGLLSVTCAVLPVMREQGSGHIFNISSVAGMVGFDQFAIYCSTKYAVEGISESLALEVEPFGIKVTSVEPGYFRTEFLTGDSMVAAAKRLPAYEKGLREQFYNHSGHQAGDPDKLAQALIKVAAAEKAPLWLPMGTDAVGMIEKKIASLQSNLEAWREVSVSTDIVE